MPTVVPREVVRDLVAAGAQLVEVLPGAEYRWAHLPGVAGEAIVAAARAQVDAFGFDPVVVVNAAGVVVRCGAGHDAVRSREPTAPAAPTAVSPSSPGHAAGRGRRAHSTGAWMTKRAQAGSPL